MKNIIIVNLILCVGLFSTWAVGQSTTSDDAEYVDECNCTPFHSCKSYVAEADGGERIDVRVNVQECSSYLDVCCNDTKIENNISSSTVSPIIINTNDSTLVTINESTNENTDGNNIENTTGQKGCVLVCDTTDPIFQKISGESTSSTIIPAVDSEFVSTESTTNSETTTNTESNSSEPHKEIQSHMPESTDNISNTDETNNNVKCGIWNKNGLGFRIINAIDSEAQYSEYPSMIALFMEEESINGQKNLVYFCGGSLIRKNVILTAAHCVDKKNNLNMIARAGEWDLKTEKENYPHQDQRVSHFVIHKDYYKGGLHNDIALVMLEQPFTLQDNIQIICLPEQNEMFTDSLCYASGWGKIVNYNNYTVHKKTESGNTIEISQYEVNILKKVELPIISREKCMETLRGTRLGPKFILHDSFICAGGEEGRDTCKGDGGSPLMCPSKEDPEYLVQAGIVAWGISCGIAGIPAAYVNVAGFREWIDYEIENYIK